MMSLLDDYNFRLDAMSDLVISFDYIPKTITVEEKEYGPNRLNS